MGFDFAFQDALKWSLDIKVDKYGVLNFWTYQIYWIFIHHSPLFEKTWPRVQLWVDQKENVESDLTINLDFVAWIIHPCYLR